MLGIMAQGGVRVHSSSCGAHFGVVHSPFDWSVLRCHCSRRYLVLFVGGFPCCGGVCVAVSCGGGLLLLVVPTILFGTV